MRRRGHRLDRNGTTLATLASRAEGGTLLLDEIGALPLTSQTRLLRLLEEREAQPVGFSMPVRVNVRIIVAAIQFFFNSFIFFIKLSNFDILKYTQIVFKAVDLFLRHFDKYPGRKPHKKKKQQTQDSCNDA